MNPRVVGIALSGLGVIAALVVTIGVAQPAIARDMALSSAPVLAREQVPTDVLPDNLRADTLGSGGLLAASARFIGKDDATSFWIVLDRASNVCLVAQSLDDGQLSAATCPSPSAFRERGAWLEVVSEQWAVEAQLRPDGSGTSVAEPGWSRIGAGLFVALDGGAQ